DKEGADNKGKDGDGDEEDDGDDGEEGDDDDDDDQEVVRDDENDDEKEGNGEEDLGLNVDREEGHDKEEEEDELYRDANINQGRGIQATLVVEDSHVTLTLVNPNGQQQSSSVSSQFVTSMLNLTLDVGMESIFKTTSQMDEQTPTSVVPLPMTTLTMTSSTIATTTTTSQAPIPHTTAPSSFIHNLPNFGSLFGFDNRLRTLEANLSEFIQTNQFAGAVSAIPGIIHRYMDQRINEAVQVAVQLHSDKLREEAQKENDEFLKTIDENTQKIMKEQVKEQVKVQVSKILPRIEQTVNEQLEAEGLTRSSHSSKTSYAVAADLSEMELKKILIKKMEGNKSIQHSDEQRNLYKALVEAYESDKIILDTYGETITLKRRHDDDADKDEEPSAEPDRGSKRCREGKEPESASAPTKTATRSAGRPPFRWKSPHIQSLTQKPPSLDRDWNKTVLTTYGSIQPWISKLVKLSDSRSSFNELIDTPLDFSNFLINRLKVDTLTPKLIVGPTYELLKGSCKSLVELEYYLEEVYKAITDQLDWVNPEGQQYPHSLLKPLPLIPNNRGRRVIPFDHFINNDLEYLRGESARDVYSKRRIITVTELKIVEWHNYKHLDWITVRRDDDKLYKFKEGYFKRIRIQDIEDMLLLLIQGKLTNLTVKECFAFNVSLRMFTRSIVIQRHVEDLQLGVESYQKKVNLTNPDSYRSNLKRKEAYTAYSNPRGFIYQNKDKKNRLMRIDELHKFRNGTLTDVCAALDDRLKGIRMQYLPQSIWRKSDKDRAAAMIQAVDKRLKTRRIMRSLERSFTLGSTKEADNVKILQSCNGLLLCGDDLVSGEFTIYEMKIGCSVWMVRYRVHTDDFMTPLLEGWSIQSNVWSIVLGEREQDSFLVIKLSGKIIQYNLISKNLREIYDCGCNQVDDNHDDAADDDDDELLQKFQSEHNVYEFIPSFASV
nr:hypothetical protein [Tanacetum cinerariifolium]